jgi:hypothetical protein
VTTPDKPSPDASELTDQRHQPVADGVRALLWMNGGAALALAFLQAIWGNDPGFSQAILRASICFLLGVLLAGSVRVLRYRAPFLLEDGEENGRKIRHAYLLAAYASFAAFIAGVVAVVFGGYRALQ